MRRYKPEPKTQSNKTWKVAAVLILLLLTATVGWAMLRREDPQVAKVRAMRVEIEQLPREQQREKWREIREEAEKLTPEQRDALRNEGRARWEQEETKRLKDFFAMTPEQQVAQLDKDIDRMRERMKQWKEREAKGKGRGGPGGDRGGGGGGGGGRGGQGGNGGGQRGQSFGRDANGNVGASQRTKDYLNRSSADTRGSRYEYRRMMNDRLRARGI